MLNAREATKKIVNASADIQKAKSAQPWPGYAVKVMNAEHRLAVLRAVFKKLQEDPDFRATYEREMSKLADDPSKRGEHSAGPAKQPHTKV
jgi:hypothetical protein